jgi:hypothetical protein
MEHAGRQRALLAVVGALSLSGSGCTERVPLISSATEVDAADEPEDAYLPPDRPVSPDAARDAGLGPEAACMETIQPHSFDLQYPEVVIALDRSFSMFNHRPGERSWWTAARDELLSYMRETDGAIAYGYTEFPGRVTCDPGIGCCVRFGPAPSINNHDGIVQRWSCNTQSCFETTDESPSGHALARIRQYYDNEQLPVPDDRFVLLLTDGAPTCAANPDECSYASDQAGTLFSKGGIKTIVLPLGDEAKNSSCLGDVAEAGKAREPGATTFPYAADTTALAAQLRKAMAPVEQLACRFRVRGDILDRDHFALTVNFKPLRRDPDHKEGWDFDDSGSPEIWLYGNTCKQLKCSQIDQSDLRAEEVCTQCGSVATCQ